jgi:hypothetical protein
VFLELLERWPSADALAAACEDIHQFARAARHGWPARFTARVTGAIAVPRLPVRPELARAKAQSIRLAASQLLILREQRRAWEHRMGELLPGGPRYCRAGTVKDPGPGKAFLGGEIYISMPGLGDRLAANGHRTALPAFGNRWLEVLWRCPHINVLYDEATHVEHQPLKLAA